MICLPFLFLQKTLYHSKINGEIQVLKSFGKTTLYVEGAPQSGGEFVKMWEELINKVISCKLSVVNCLVLGLGGGTVIHTLKKYYPNSGITVVEVDPVMEEIARKHFNFTKDLSVEIIVDDAVSWLNKQKKSYLFDLIIVDLFIGKLNPVETRNAKFLVRLKNLLTKSGIILYNAHFQANNPEEFDKFVHLNKSIFGSVQEVFQYPCNRVLLFEN